MALSRMKLSGARKTSMALTKARCDPSEGMKLILKLPTLMAIQNSLMTGEPLLFLTLKFNNNQNPEAETLNLALVRFAGDENTKKWRRTK